MHRTTFRGSTTVLIGLVSVLVVFASYLSATATAPSPEDLAKAQQDVQKQQDAAAGNALEFAAGQERLAHLAEVAGAALQVFDEADRAEELAQADLWAARNELQAAQYQVTQTKSHLGRWAADSYRRGADNSTLMRLAAIGQGTSGDVMETAYTLGKVGTSRSDLAARAQEAQSRANAAEVKAADAQKLAQERRQVAEKAKAKADQAVAAQEAEVAALRQQLESSQSALQLAQDEAARLTQAKQAADAAREEALRLAQNRSDITGPVGSCTGGDLRGHPNGKLPVSALCPLWGAPGHFLRADAANAFEQMSQAYAQQTGKPLCVTDSYRNYATQVRLKKQKPRLAAKAGTSNHGWARAVDFCGGVNKFDTPAHNWMRLNAPRFGWYHPTWARKNGSKPEAWHWEYAARV